LSFVDERLLAPKTAKTAETLRAKHPAGESTAEPAEMPKPLKLEPDEFSKQFDRFLLEVLVPSLVFDPTTYATPLKLSYNPLLQKRFASYATSSRPEKCVKPFNHFLRAEV
jgi:hypothetical protein